jgi:hypothetical protein
MGVGGCQVVGRAIAIFGLMKKIRKKEKENNQKYGALLLHPLVLTPCCGVDTVGCLVVCE